MPDSQPRIHLVTGVLQRAGALLLVASRYPNHRDPLWNLPGGRQRHGELLEDALRREFMEETSLDVRIGQLRYVAESYDIATATHVTNFAFDVEGQGQPLAPACDAHVVEIAWTRPERIAERVRVAVVREPLLANLENPERRYFAFPDAGITIEFADCP